MQEGLLAIVAITCQSHDCSAMGGGGGVHVVLTQHGSPPSRPSAERGVPLQTGAQGDLDKQRGGEGRATAAVQPPAGRPPSVQRHEAV